MWYIFKVNKVHKKLIVNKSIGSFNFDFTYVFYPSSSNYDKLFKKLWTTTS
jgi:hypothetical protein